MSTPSSHRKTLLIKPSAIEVTTQIARFNTHDATEISTLIGRAVRAVFRQSHQPKGAQPALPGIPPEKIIEMSDTGTVLVAQSCGQFVGTGTLIGDWVYNVYVEPDFWRCGIGRSIMEALECHARSRHARAIGVFSNIAAVEFYEKCDFRRHQALTCNDREVVEMYKDVSPSVTAETV